MFNVKIIFLSILTDITDVEELNLAVEDNSTIRDILNQLASKFGAKFEKMIYKTSSDLSKYILITVNGKHIRLIKGLATKVQADDEVSFIPAIAGG